MPDGDGTSPRCKLCGVTVTSLSNMKEHLLGRQHQQKAREVPRPARCQPYISLRVTENLCEIGIEEFYDVFDTFGELSDFRFTVLKRRDTKPKNGTKIYVKYSTKEATDRALASSQTGQLVVSGETISQLVAEPSSDDGKTSEVSPKPSSADDKTKRKKKKPVPDDSVDHTLVVTTLGQLVQTRSEDEVLIWLADQLLLTPAEHQQRAQLCLDLQAGLRAQFCTCFVQMFGSSVNGLGFHGCDLDLYTYIDANNPASGLPAGADDKTKVRRVAKMLNRFPQLCTNIVRIPKTRVPLVKFRSPRLDGVQCDMSFSSPMSFQNSRMIGWLMKADQRARLITVAIRYWARRRNVAGGEHHPSKMSSYCFTLVVVTFLQQLQPPVLPSVDWCQAQVEELRIGPWNAAFATNAVWHSTNTTPASQLLRQFFRYYAEFPAELEALSPLRGGPVPRSELTDRPAGRYGDLVAARRVKPLVVNTPLVVQDPMELNNNKASSYQQRGLDWFRQCCQEAVGMPLARLFDEQALPKATKRKKAAAAIAAASAVTAGSPGAAKRSLETARRKAKPSADDGRSCAAVPAGGSGGKQVPEVSNSSDRLPVAADGDRCNASRLAPDSLRSGDRAEKMASSAAKGRSSVPQSENGNRSAAAAAATNAKVAKINGADLPPSGPAVAKPIISDQKLKRRMLADFTRPPSRVISFPLETVAGRPQPLAEHERSRQAAAFAWFLEQVFTVVMRFECRSMSFDDLELATDVVRGFTCEARLPTWQYRKLVAAQLIGRQRTLEFEAEVTERALLMSGQPAPKPLASFSCFLVLEGDQLRLRLYKGKTQKAGKNCYYSLGSLLPELAKRLDYVALFGEERLGKK